jgi:hypothetical protein
MELSSLTRSKADCFGNAASSGAWAGVSAHQSLIFG